MNNIKKFESFKSDVPEYSDIIGYIEKKYKIDVREFYSNGNTEPDDFWHYLVEINPEFHPRNRNNGDYIYIPKKAVSTKRTPQQNLDTFNKILDYYNSNPAEFDEEDFEILHELIEKEKESINNPIVDNSEYWKQEITDLIFKEYGELSKDDMITVWVSW